jgi:hypothetical protein
MTLEVGYYVKDAGRYGFLLGPFGTKAGTQAAVRQDWHEPLAGGTFAHVAPPATPEPYRTAAWVSAGNAGPSQGCAAQGAYVGRGPPGEQQGRARQP